MKRKLFNTILLVGTTLLFSQCDNSVFEEQLEYSILEENFPKEAEEFGLAVADELSTTIKNMHRMGIDYSDAKDTEDFKKRFYEDYWKASPNALRTTQESLISLKNQTSQNTVNRVKNLTEIQLKFISRIISESKESHSDADYCNRLLRINEDIYKEVPIAQQERLFYITSVLYYSLIEVQHLESRGMMIPTSLNQRYSMLKTRSESGNGGGSCRTFLATAWAIAIGEPTPIGEIVYSVVLIYAGAQLLYEVTVCSRQVNCEDEYFDCVMSGKYKDKPNMCNDCFRYCQGQNVWDCPRPY